MPLPLQKSNMPAATLAPALTNYVDPLRTLLFLLPKHTQTGLC
jgi:hypothetical protein